MSDFINEILYVWANKTKKTEEKEIDIEKERKWLNVDHTTYDAFTITLFHFIFSGNENNSQDLHSTGKAYFGLRTMDISIGCIPIKCK